MVTLSRALDTLLAACRSEPPSKKPELDAAADEAANDALENRFNFYGEKHQLAEDIDWEFNPGTWHWGHDLHRFSYLGPLTTAYEATGDVRYARKAKELILDWIAKCDFGRSFNIEKYAFGAYLNLTIHAAAWSRTVKTLAAYGQVEPLELLRILKSLHDHLAYLEIVTNGHSGNWPTIGCMGMLATLEALPVFKDADRWIEYCRTTMDVQIAEQVLPDGVQDELTPHYHRVVINNLLSAARSLRSLGSDLTPATLETLRKMVQYTQQAVVPDGSKQLAFNDSDPGSVPDLRRLLDSAGLGNFLRPESELGPEFFPYAGVAFLRQRPDKGDLYLAFDAGPFGRGHQHEDKLGFWLFAYGHNFLVDPGRHLYDWSARSFYPYLITTRAHSTIMVDGEGQNSRAHPNTWIAKAPLDIEWSASDEEVRAAGTYDFGYGKNNAIKVVHRREIVFVRERCWVIFDTLTGDGDHSIESRFQFAPGKVVLDGTRVRTENSDANLLLWPVGAGDVTDTHIEEGQENPRGGWYSDGYNKIEPAPAFSQTRKGALPIRIATLLFPYKGETQPDVKFDFDGETATLRTKYLGEVRVQSK